MDGLYLAYEYRLLREKGMSVVGFAWYRLVIAVFGVILIYFGLTFILGYLTL